MHSGIGVVGVLLSKAHALGLEREFVRLGFHVLLQLGPLASVPACASTAVVCPRGRNRTFTKPNRVD